MGGVLENGSVAITKIPTVTCSIDGSVGEDISISNMGISEISQSSIRDIHNNRDSTASAISPQKFPIIEEIITTHITNIISDNGNKSIGIIVWVSSTA